MTLVVGAHLGDAVGIAADTRVTRDYSDGTRKLSDDALKVYVFPHCLVGIVGSAQSAATFLNMFRLKCFARLSARDEFSNVVNIQWMHAHLVRVFERACAAGSLDRSRKFRCVFACEDTVAPQDPVRITAENPTQHVSVVTDSSFGSQAKVLTQYDAMPSRRVVFSIEFPSRQIQTAEPGEVIVVGSGALSEHRLKKRRTAYAITSELSLGSRIGALAFDIGTAAKIADDTSFNGIVVGLAVRRGYIEATLNGFHHWPSHSEAQSGYEWRPMDSVDVAEIPHATPFAVSLDIRESNVGWIYDLKLRRKVRLRSFLPGQSSADEDDAAVELTV